MANQQPPDHRQPNAQQGQSNNRPVRNPALTAQRPPPAHRPIPTVIWDPRRYAANDLQAWAGQNLTPFLRSRFPVVDRVTGRVHANHDFDPDINSAIQWSEHIDAFDNNPDLMDELILFLTHPQQADQNMATIAQDRRLVEILLYRHYQRHGGLVLPPIAGARAAIEHHAQAVQVAYQQEVPVQYHPRVVFPNWTFGNTHVAAQTSTGTPTQAFAPTTPGRGAAPPPVARARQSPRGPVHGGCNPDLTPLGNNQDRRRDPGAGGAGFLGERKPSRYFGGWA